MSDLFNSRRLKLTERWRLPWVSDRWFRRCCGSPYIGHFASEKLAKSDADSLHGRWAWASAVRTRRYRRSSFLVNRLDSQHSRSNHRAERRSWDRFVHNEASCCSCRSSTPGRLVAKRLSPSAVDRQPFHPHRLRASCVFDTRS